MDWQPLFTICDEMNMLYGYSSKMLHIPQTFLTMLDIHSTIRVARNNGNILNSRSPQVQFFSWIGNLYSHSFSETSFLQKLNKISFKTNLSNYVIKNSQNLCFVFES